MNRKLILGTIIVLVILIVIIIALLIAGPKTDVPTDNPTQTDELATDLQNLASGDTILDQNLASDIVDIGE